MFIEFEISWFIMKTIKVEKEKEIKMSTLNNRIYFNKIFQSQIINEKINYQNQNNENLNILG
jgi:hypothetical protein